MLEPEEDSDISTQEDIDPYRTIPVLARCIDSSSEVVCDNVVVLAPPSVSFQNTHFQIDPVSDPSLISHTRKVLRQWNVFEKNRFVTTPIWWTMNDSPNLSPVYQCKLAIWKIDTQSAVQWKSLRALWNEKYPKALASTKKRFLIGARIFNIEAALFCSRRVWDLTQETIMMESKWKVCFHPYIPPQWETPMSETAFCSYNPLPILLSKKDRAALLKFHIQIATVVQSSIKKDRELTLKRFHSEIESESEEYEEVSIVGESSCSEHESETADSTQIKHQKLEEPVKNTSFIETLTSALDYVERLESPTEPNSGNEDDRKTQITISSSDQSLSTNSSQESSPATPKQNTWFRSFFDNLEEFRLTHSQIDAS